MVRVDLLVGRRHGLNPRTAGNRIPSAILSTVKGSRYSMETMRLMGLCKDGPRLLEAVRVSPKPGYSILYLNRGLLYTQMWTSERIRYEISEKV